MTEHTTLLINISPGDVSYAELTVTALVNQPIDINWPVGAIRYIEQHDNVLMFLNRDKKAIK